MPHSDTADNALYKQKLAQCVKITLTKYYSDPPTGYGIIREKRYNTGNEMHSSVRVLLARLTNLELRIDVVT